LREDEKDFIDSDSNCKTWEVEQNFKEFYYWNREIIPSQQDPVRKWFQWVQIADKIHSPISKEEFEKQKDLMIEQAKQIQEKKEVKTNSSIENGKDRALPEDNKENIATTQELEKAEKANTESPSHKRSLSSSQSLNNNNSEDEEVEPVIKIKRKRLVPCGI